MERKDILGSRVSLNKDEIEGYVYCFRNFIGIYWWSEVLFKKILNFSLRDVKFVFR